METYSSILAWRIPIDRGAWRAAVHRVAKSRTCRKESDMTGRLSTAQDGDERLEEGKGAGAAGGSLKDEG